MVSKPTTIVHCSYHKCLTTYYIRVMDATFNRTIRWSRGYRHFNSKKDDFYDEYQNYRLTSVNNHRLELDRLGNCRVSRFVRDPRDLVVSGYFYHKRGAEGWTNIVGPKDKDWEIVNGVIPAAMSSDQSFASYLQSLPEEEGLMAEIEFRKNHFDSMLDWPKDEDGVKLFKYEDVIRKEQEIYKDLFDLYGFSTLERTVGMHFARKFSLSNRKRSDAHIRNPSPHQWKKHFSEKVASFFLERHGAVLEHLGYSVD